jgi:uncharacterized RDD family membrane protein YckC
MNPTGQNSSAVVIDQGLPAAALEGVRSRRVWAVCFDLLFVIVLVAIAFMVLAVLGIVTFGLTWMLIPFLFPIVAFFYNGLTVSGWRRATPGMKLMDLEVSLTDGRPVPFINAAAHAVLFYLSWTILTPFSLLVCLFTQNKRCLHDMLADIVITRRRS